MINSKKRVLVGIRIDPVIRDRAKLRANLQTRSFSNYIEHLIKRDLHGAPQHLPENPAPIDHSSEVIHQESGD